jgi:cell pole-organizing protein PopZ
MSDSSQEPTMEEILASIRRIISEDDAPEAAASPAPPSAQPPPPVESEPEPEPELPSLEDEDLGAMAGADFDDADELELTEKVESHGDLDVYSAAAAAEPADLDLPDLGALVSAPAAAAASAAFGRLSGNMAMPAAGRTLEDVVRELLRPLLQQWLDENLPGIVQRAVDTEVTRIARGG